MELAYRRITRAALIGAFCVPLFVLLTPDADRSRIIPAGANNLYQDSIAAEWRLLVEKLPIRQDMALEYLKMDYEPDGTIRGVDWRVSYGEEGGEALFYNITRTAGETGYRIEKSSGKHPFTYKLLLDDLCYLLTPDAIRLMSPRDPDFNTLIVSPMLHTINPATPTDYYGIRDGQVIGPLKEGIGYVASVFPMYNERDVSASRNWDRYYLLGGTWSQ